MDSLICKIDNKKLIFCIYCKYSHDVPFIKD